MGFVGDGSAYCAQRSFEFSRPRLQLLDLLLEVLHVRYGLSAPRHSSTQLALVLAEGAHLVPFPPVIKDPACFNTFNDFPPLANTEIKQRTVWA